jgi:NAD dependent epimerase/dehydratase family enzyme
MSWVALEDVVRVILFALAAAGLSGPVNVVAPNPVRNAEFAKILARVLHRPALFPAPAFALRLALGELADALLLSSQRVLPERLRQAGYSFVHQSLEPALASVLRS